jgi:hypothetical protein
MSDRATPPISSEVSLSSVDDEYFRQLAPYFKKCGWLESVRSKRPMDENGRPLPWYTYPAISFLSKRIHSDLTVFEFGSGNSTLWWAARVKRVHAVENHKGWAAQMKSNLPGNVTYRYESLVPDGEYCRSAKTTKLSFDVIVIDGRDRVNCARHSLEAISREGVFIWDNSDRIRYSEGFDLLHAENFKRIDFQGLGPINTKPWMTSVFYRSNNCFGI